MNALTILYSLFIMPLQLFFEVVFSFAQRFTDNPGLSIIVLSLTMNFLVLPLYKRADAIQDRQREISKKMQRGISHIKRVYSGDEKMMMLQTYYRQNHYKPTDVFKESLSLLIQIPFFIAAYRFLSNLALLDGAAFGPIRDLGMPDALVVVGNTSFNFLPVLMTLINIISCLIYTKGFPLKSKLQLYIMAFLFLILLYNSPSGLVLYWTLNNLFSLIKNIFFKLKDPTKLLSMLCSLCGVVLALYSIAFFDNTLKRRIIVVLFGLFLQIPFAVRLLFKSSKVNNRIHLVFPKANRELFLLSSIMLSTFIGGLIPSALLKSSPQEFINISLYYNPLWYLFYVFLVSVGYFVLWTGVFYSVADNTGKVIIEKIMLLFCGTAVIDYMFFGTDLGIISATLCFEEDLIYSWKDKIVNLLVICILLFLVFISTRFEKYLDSILITIIVVVLIMTGINAFISFRAIKPVEARIKSGEKISFNLSKNGKNIIVLMLDRAIGPYVPYIMNEKPELKEKYDGFTWYSNSLSFSNNTNTGAPALFGGYEYSPVELNKRDKERLVDKHNESLKVMPVLFDENGYEVTVCDVPYANYQWIPDMTIYDDYPGINTYNTEGMFSLKVQQSKLLNTRRNLFFYSLMKASPVIIQKYIYGGSNYNHLTERGYTSTGQVTEGTSVAQGISSEFLSSFDVLKNIEKLTDISSSEKNTFLMMNNNATHEPILLQEPEYLPKESVNNTDFDAANVSRFSVDGKEIKMENVDHFIHYETDMACMIQLGKWFDYMRENGVYDNTRIILVSDHGRNLSQFDELELKEDGKYYDLEKVSHLLMVKDFNEKGFKVSDEFMTIADVPTIAVSGIIDNPVNHFTGKPINNDDKFVGEQYILLDSPWEVGINNGTQFLPGDWLAVHDNIWDKNNWRVVARDAVFAGKGEE